MGRFTIVRSVTQAVELVGDHEVDCRQCVQTNICSKQNEVPASIRETSSIFPRTSHLFQSSSVQSLIATEHLLDLLRELLRVSNRSEFRLHAVDRIDHPNHISTISINNETPHGSLLTGTRHGRCSSSCKTTDDLRRERSGNCSNNAFARHSAAKEKDQRRQREKVFTRSKLGSVRNNGHEEY